MQTSHSKLKQAIRFLIIVVAWIMSFGAPAHAQTYEPAAVSGYRYVERTIYVKEPVTLERWVTETNMETELVKEMVPVTQIETRERRRTVNKPITRTTMKEQRTVVQKPVTETRYREREIEETSYDYVTEMRDEQVTVQKPVIETTYRDEQYTVRQKVTQDLIEVKNETVYKPTTMLQTVYYPTQTMTTVPDANARPQLKWLDTAGYYTDPTTGQSVWRRRGFHWAQPECVAATTSLMPANVEQTVMVPETVQSRRPVEVSRYEDRVETRRVPVEVERMVSETVSRQVPVTVKKPVVKRRIEKVPYTETRYVDVEEVRQIPVEETVYQEVVETEPYEVEVTRWKEITREVEVPRTVRRREQYQEMREVAKVITVKIPVDELGRALSLGEPVSDEELKKSLPHSSGYGTTTGQPRQIEGAWDKSTEEQKDRPKSVLVQETKSSAPLQSIDPADGAKVDAADERPTLSEGSKLDSSEIQKIPVRKPSLDLEIRPPSRPELGSANQDDVIAAER
jgi:hypothetical protein